MKSSIVWHLEAGQRYPSRAEAFEVMKAAAKMLPDVDESLEVSDFLETKEGGD